MSSTFGFILGTLKWCGGGVFRVCVLATCRPAVGEPGWTACASEPVRVRLCGRVSCWRVLALLRAYAAGTQPGRIRSRGILKAMLWPIFCPKDVGHLRREAWAATAAAVSTGGVGV